MTQTGVNMCTGIYKYGMVYQYLERGQYDKKKHFKRNLSYFPSISLGCLQTDCLYWMLSKIIGCI